MTAPKDALLAAAVQKLLRALPASAGERLRGAPPLPAYPPGDKHRPRTE